MKFDPDKFLPLAPATLHILLALAGEDMHGYGIMQDVTRQSNGRYKLGPGTLYDNLQRLLQGGLVEEVDRPEESRRKYYRLSRNGRAVLRAEVERLQQVLNEAKAHMRTNRCSVTSIS
jgi:DNA-binding PadR family transcriptional regulator